MTIIPILVSLLLALQGIVWGSAPVVAAPAEPAPILVPASFEELLGMTWPEHRHAEVRAVVECESGWDASEVGSQGERGLMQIHPAYWPDLAEDYDLFDPEQNLRAGRIAFVRWQETFNESGWNAWSCQP